MIQQAPNSTTPAPGATTGTSPPSPVPRPAELTPLQIILEDVEFLRLIAETVKHRKPRMARRLDAIALNLENVMGREAKILEALHTRHAAELATATKAADEAKARADDLQTQNNLLHEHIVELETAAVGAKDATDVSSEEAALAELNLDANGDPLPVATDAAPAQQG